MDCQVTVNRHDMYISLYISLLLGELTHRALHTDMLCMALGESLKGFSLLHAHSKVRGVTVAVTESEAGVCLALLVQGK